MDETGEEKMQKQLGWFLALIVGGVMLICAAGAGIVWLCHHLQWK